MLIGQGSGRNGRKYWFYPSGVIPGAALDLNFASGIAYNHTADVREDISTYLDAYHTRASTAYMAGSDGVYDLFASGVMRQQDGEGSLLEGAGTNAVANNSDLTGDFRPATIPFNTSTKVSGVLLGLPSQECTAFTGDEVAWRYVVPGVSEGQVAIVSGYCFLPADYVGGVRVDLRDGAFADISSQLAPGETRRFEVSLTAGSGGSDGFLDIQGTVGSSSIVGIKLAGIQVEVGASFASSPIVTAGASAARAADSLIIPTADFGLGATGTIVLEMAATTYGPVMCTASLSDGTLSNHAYIGQIVSNGGAIRAALLDAGGIGNTQVVLSQGGIVKSPGDTTKVAFAYASNDFAGCIDGGDILTDASGSVPAFTQLRLGSTAAGTQAFNGIIRRATIFASRLPDAELQALTS